MTENKTKIKNQFLVSARVPRWKRRGGELYRRAVLSNRWPRTRSRLPGHPHDDDRCLSAARVARYRRRKYEINLVFIADIIAEVNNNATRSSGVWGPVFSFSAPFSRNVGAPHRPVSRTLRSTFHSVPCQVCSSKCHRSIHSSYKTGTGVVFRSPNLPLPLVAYSVCLRFGSTHETLYCARAVCYSITIRVVINCVLRT